MVGSSIVVRWAKSTDIEFVDYIRCIINDSYAESEDGMWEDGVDRISNADLCDIIKSGELFLAVKDNEIVGTGRTTIMNNSGCLGLLTCAKKCRGLGIGKLLLRFHEDNLLKNGFTISRVELLYPIPISSFKQRVLSWYLREGYVDNGHEDFHPELKHKLVCKWEFKVFLKELRI